MVVNNELTAGQSPNVHHLKVLGGVALTRDGRPVNGMASQRRNLALLAIVGVSRQLGVSREKVAALLWPESDETNARNSIKQALYVIRHEVDPDAIAGNAELRLGLDVIGCDLDVFERFVGDEKLEAAVDAYSGPFLDGFHLGGAAEEFELWVDAERARIGRLFAESLETLATRAEESGDTRNAVRWWVRRSDLTPLESHLALRAATAQIAMGDPAGAIRRVEAHRALLKAELGIPLGAELEMVIANARSPREPSAAAPATATNTPSIVEAQRAPIRRTPPAVLRETATVRAGGWRSGATLAAATVLVAVVAFSWWRVATTHAATVDPRRVALVAAHRVGEDTSARSLVRLMTESMARDLTAIAVAKPVVLTASDSADPRVAGRRAGAPLVATVFAADGSASVDVALTSTETGERVWGLHFAVPQTTDASTPDVSAAAERAATAIAVRVDPHMLHWIGLSSEPTTLASYQEFSRGLNFFLTERGDSATEHLLAVAQRDTSFIFALAFAAAASTFSRYGKHVDSILKVLGPRRLRPLDRALTDYLIAFTGPDRDAEYRAAVALSAVAPRTEWRYLHAATAVHVGRSAEAVRVMDEIGPDLGWLHDFRNYWYFLSRALHHLGRHERELRDIEEARRRFPADRFLAQGEIKALAGLGRVAAIDSVVDEAMTLRQHGGMGDNQPVDQAIEELWAHGNEAAARRLAVRAVAWSERFPAGDRWGMAHDPGFLYYTGDLIGARKQILRDGAGDPKKTDYLFLAVIAARLGDTLSARQYAAQQERQWDPADDGTLFDRARLAAALGDRDGAMVLLRADLERGDRNRFTWHLWWPGLESLKGYPPFEKLAGPVD